MDVKDSSNKAKFSKIKLKKLYSKIKKQMEFYFSDSNLNKDKFLHDLIINDDQGYVDLKVFKTFNKIKALTDSCEVIASAVSRSNMFELSENQKRLRRVTPIELSKDFDACTLYVEKLPPYADQKWVKDVFGQFGSVKYVNVPRYKAATNIKGFAFVEFEDASGVKNACEFYKMSAEKECSASEDENKSAKNAKKHKHEEIWDKRGKKSRGRSGSESSEKFADFSSLKRDHHHHHHEASGKELGLNKDHHQKNKKKRKLEDSVSENTSKKVKESTEEDSTRVVKSDEPIKEESGLQKDSVQPEDIVMSDDPSKVVETSDNQMNEPGVEESKKKRKRKSSKKHHSNTEKPSLRVMPKSEWKAYRNKYLELQRSITSMLKRQVLLEIQELKEHDSNAKAVDAPETKKTLQFQPGVIIKVKLSEPVKNSTDIKDQVKANAVVAYVDAPVESSEIFIRCHNAEEAQTVMKDDKMSHLGEAELLKDTEEKEYWDKIESDRKTKFSNPVRHKKRGRDKLIAKVAKLEEMKNRHIYFDE